MFRDLQKKYSDYKLMFIEEISKTHYLFYFSNDDRLLCENLMKETEFWDNYNIYSSIFNIEVPFEDKDGKPIELVIVEIIIPFSAGLKSLSDTINKMNGNTSRFSKGYLPLTLDELYLNYNMSLLGAFTQDRKKYYEFCQGMTLDETLNQVESIYILNSKR